jgi:hypothetical protein
MEIVDIKLKKDTRKKTDVKAWFKVQKDPDAKDILREEIKKCTNRLK